MLKEEQVEIWWTVVLVENLKVIESVFHFEITHILLLPNSIMKVGYIGGIGKDVHNRQCVFAQELKKVKSIDVVIRNYFGKQQNFS